MEHDGGNYNPGLNSAVVSTGECYEEIGRLYEEQPRYTVCHYYRPGYGSALILGGSGSSGFFPCGSASEFGSSLKYLKIQIKNNLIKKFWS